MEWREKMIMAGKDGMAGKDDNLAAGVAERAVLRPRLLVACLEDPSLGVWVGGCILEGAGLDRRGSLFGSLRPMWGFGWGVGWGLGGGWVGWGFGFCG
jgi:hypothetical protein